MIGVDCFEFSTVTRDHEDHTSMQYVASPGFCNSKISVESSISGYNESPTPPQTSLYESVPSGEMEWKKKLIRNWSPSDIVQWLNSFAINNNVWCTKLSAETFVSVGGAALEKATKKEMIRRNKTFGLDLFSYLQKTKQELEILSDSGEDFKKESKSESIVVEAVSHENEVNKVKRSNVTKFGQDRFLPRSRKKSEKKKIGRLWEFIRDLLKNENYCPSIIMWENYDEGMFRLVHSRQVAKLWGEKKKNPEMNYEKLSRAMRYYYKRDIFLPVWGQRLVYRFGSRATGWKV